MLHNRNSLTRASLPGSSVGESLQNFSSSAEPNAKMAKKSIKIDTSKSEKSQVQSSNSSTPQMRSYAQMISEYTDAMNAGEKQQQQPKAKSKSTKGLLSRLPFESVVSTLARFERPKFGKTANTKSPVLNESPKRDYFTRQDIKVRRDGSRSSAEMQRDLDLVCGPGESLPLEWVSQQHQEPSSRKRRLNSINIMFDEAVSPSTGGTEKLRIVTSNDKIEIQIPISTREYRQLQQQLSKLNPDEKLQEKSSLANAKQPKPIIPANHRKHSKDSNRETSGKSTQSAMRQSNKLFHPTRNKALPWWASTPETKHQVTLAQSVEPKVLASNEQPPGDSKGDGNKPKKDTSTTEEKKPDSGTRTRRRKKLSGIAKVKKHLEVELEEKKKEKQEQPAKKTDKEGTGEDKKKGTEDGGGGEPPKSARNRQSRDAVKISPDKVDESVRLESESQEQSKLAKDRQSKVAVETNPDKVEKSIQLINERKREPPTLDHGDGIGGPTIRPIEKMDEGTRKSRSRRISLPELKKTISAPQSRAQQPRRSGIPLKIPPSDTLLKTRQKELSDALALAEPCRGEPSGDDGNGSIGPGDLPRDQTGASEDVKSQAEDSGETSALTQQKLEQIKTQRREFLAKLGLDWDSLEARLNRRDSESSLGDTTDKQLVYSTWLHRFHTRRSEPLVK